MSYPIVKNIVVQDGLARGFNGSRPPYRQVHAHSTGNRTATVQNEITYLKNHQGEANYTHIVGIEDGEAVIYQLANVNQSAFDVGGDWNQETYAAVELAEGSIKTQEDFNKAYPAYVWLLRKLGNEAGTNYTLDDATVSDPWGIITHNYATYHQPNNISDHVDPLPFLALWGVNYDKFKNDIANGVGDAQPSASAQPAPTPVAPQPQATGAIQAFKNAGNNFTAYNGFRADEIKQVNGIWQMINYDLAGGRDFSWTNNGIPLDILDNITRGNQAATQVGDTLKFNGNYNHGTIDDYDTSSNAVGIKYGNYGEIWFNADAFLKL